MRAIVAVAVNTFREAVRDRVLYGVLGVATSLLLFSLVLAELSLDQQRRIVLDLGLASISLFSVLAAVFLGSSLLYKEIERKTLYVILPKPIRRYEFLLGKYFGIALTVFVFVALQGAVQLCVSAVQADAPWGWVAALAVGSPLLLGAMMWKSADRTAVIVPWAVLVFAGAALLTTTTDIRLGPTVAALALTLNEVLLLTAVALFFSAFSTPFLTALFTTGVWLVGRNADAMSTMKSKAMPEVVKALLREVVKVWPNFNLFVPGRHALESALGDVASSTGGVLPYVANAAVYSIAYAGIVLALAALVFQRRDLL